MNNVPKKSLIVMMIAVAAAAAAAAVVFTLLMMSSGGSEPPRPETQTTAVLSAADAAPANPADTVPSASAAPSAARSESEQPTTVNIALPYAEGEITRFSGIYVPDVRAEDTETGSVVHLRELFGANYAGAAITFREDGTFTDTLRDASGQYQVENGALTAVVLPDETMDITVTEWEEDGRVPVTFCVVYRTVGDKGFKVFYSKQSKNEE